MTHVRTVAPDAMVTRYGAVSTRMPTPKSTIHITNTENAATHSSAVSVAARMSDGLCAAGCRMWTLSALSTLLMGPTSLTAVFMIVPLQYAQILHRKAHEWKRPGNWPCSVRVVSGFSRTVILPARDAPCERRHGCPRPDHFWIGRRGRRCWRAPRHRRR